MALVAPLVCRYTINGTLFGRPTAQIIDVQLSDGSGVGLAREDAVEDMAATILETYVDTFRTGQNAAWAFTSVTWVDLNSADGSTGIMTQTANETLPQNGAVSGEALPASVAALVTKAGSSARGRRRGRMFMPGLSEANVSGNLLLTNYINAMQPLFDAFLLVLNVGAPTDPSPWSRMVVVHTTGGGQNYAGVSAVTSLALEQQVASQRRRNRG
uniref:Uncharacterized protein n=1 Tax=uncultured prokaryote TaxID=198431 RepID=A0A0H5PY30_9ZZZZ|nr:hypothetical protein [uncultured prokaryote]